MKGRVDLQTTRGFQHHDGNQLVHMLVKLLFHLPPQVFELKMKNQKQMESIRETGQKYPLNKNNNPKKTPQKNPSAVPKPFHSGSYF